MGGGGQYGPRPSRECLIEVGKVETRGCMVVDQYEQKRPGRESKGRSVCQSGRVIQGNQWYRASRGKFSQQVDSESWASKVSQFSSSYTVPQQEHGSSRAGGAANRRESGVRILDLVRQSEAHAYPGVSVSHEGLLVRGLYATYQFSLFMAAVPYILPR